VSSFDGQNWAVSVIAMSVDHPDATSLGSAGQLKRATPRVEAGCHSRGDAPRVDIGPAHRILQNPSPPEQPGMCWPSIVMAGDCDASPTSTVTPSAASRKVAIGSKRRARVAASRPASAVPVSCSVPPPVLMKTASAVAMRPIMMATPPAAPPPARRRSWSATDSRSAACPRC